MKKLVVRDVNGSVINIGPWEYCVVDGGITNPMPEGSTAAEEEVVVTEDGGLAAANDHVSLRRVAYPRLADQLDAIWKGGTDAEAMRTKVLGVKAKYPKS